MTNNEIAAIHTRLRRTYGSASMCVYCNEPSYHFEWANVTGEYTDNIEDYLPMCLSHHRQFDMSTDTARENCSKAQKGNRNGIIPVLCDIGNNIKIEFESSFDAERITGVLHTSIANCLAGRAKTAGGYKWSRGILT